MAWDDDAPVKSEEDFATNAKKISISAASEIEDMRQTAKARIEGHLREAERFRVLSESHSHAASLWREIADSDRVGAGVPAEGNQFRSM